MQYDRPIVLSIAGFDPCAGAGVLADVKTFEQHGCLGMAVVSALTTQVEDHFISANWLPAEKIIESLSALTNKYEIAVAKIGLIENLDTLEAVLGFLKSHNPHLRLVWDPVLSASSGFRFMDATDPIKFEKLLKDIFLLTPNTLEVLSLTGMDDSEKAAAYLSSHCAVLLKGGHSAKEKGTDLLFRNKLSVKIPAGSGGALFPKHGSGCILSAAIASQLALNQDLESACRLSKHYVEKALSSNTHLLAYHAV